MKVSLCIILTISLSHFLNGQIINEIPTSIASATYNGIILSNTNQPKKPHNESRTRLKSIYTKGIHFLASSKSVGHSETFAIKFTNTQLGESSFIYLENTSTGNYQYFDQVAMDNYGSISSEFEPGNVRIELYVSELDENVRFEIESLIVPESSSSTKARIQSICNNDGRTNSNDPAVGRTNGGCTAWIVSNGSLLSAGHCADNLTRVDFNVPISNPDGSNNFPPQSDRYVRDVIWWEDGDQLGNDWAVFTCHPNSTTGLTPIQAQNSFYRMSKDHDPSLFRITGFGNDDGEDDNSQQTATGTNVNEVSKSNNRVYWKHKVDTEPGNSGSPIIVNGTSTTVGIHTNGGCGGFLGTGTNKGTSFESNDLEQVIHNVPSVGLDGQLIYVDNGDIVSGEDGGVFRPYSSVGTAIAAVDNGGILSIVSGVYREEIHINKPLTILAPSVGSVTIGPNGTGVNSVVRPVGAYAYQLADLNEDPNNLNLLYEDPDDLESSPEEDVDISKKVLIYPNPFLNSISIESIDRSELQSIRIFDLTGRVLQSFTKSQVELHKSQIILKINNFDGDGTYILEIITTKGVFKQRMERTQ